MATITKKEIAERIATRMGRTKVSVKQIVQFVLDEIINDLVAGKRIEFRDFGVFEVVTRKPRMGRNPRTGEKVGVPPKRVVTFKMGKLMKERLASNAHTASAESLPPSPSPATP